MSSSETSRDESRPSGTQVLFWWQKYWGRLTKLQAARFQDRLEVHELTQLEGWAVHDAIEQTKKLVDIVPLAKRLHASGPTQPSRSRAPKRSAPAKPSTRPWGMRHVPPVLGGRTNLGPAPSNSGLYMSRPPSHQEPAIGERCSGCGAWVPSGGVHDCA